jgi:hypothetical protein
VQRERENERVKTALRDFEQKEERELRRKSQREMFSESERARRRGILGKSWYKEEDRGNEIEIDR